ncbi:zinc finger CCCH domain-containing protein 16 isoform X2 [Cucurbita maxima]|uniref:Zinc finger CCCH domain-containing protein 16 isoform X2 n=1 Tax=Cucurbita maxima TaxID=3661 RepID=A0A6J1L2U5_CUCMA|nr:zinc finger CCCH domain-containing protein 16 isoform X2 [Cucurbita maxima]
MVKGANFSTSLSNHRNRVTLALGCKQVHSNSKNLIPLDLEFIVLVNLKQLLILDPNKTNISYMRTNGLVLPHLLEMLLLENQTISLRQLITYGESCKRQIAEDFQNERPLWKLTCYGHSKSQPCDIVGDVSYEELRAIAYDEAKRGISLQSIVERERNLLNSKLAEFESLLHKPYVTPLNRASGNQSSLSGTNSLSIQPSSQNSGPPSLSSFSQLGASLNTGFGARPSNPPNNAFGQPVQFSSSPENSSAFGATNFPSTNAGAVGGVFGSQVPSQTFGNSTVSGFNNSGITNAGSNLLSSPAIPTKFPSTDAGGQILSNAQLVNKLQQENSSVDVSIWLKEKWVPGEIPEVAPPDAVVQ